MSYSVPTWSDVLNLLALALMVLAFRVLLEVFPL